MSMLLQQIAIIIVVGLAVAYIVYHFVRRKRRKTPCANCPALHAMKERPKNPIQPPVVRN